MMNYLVPALMCVLLFFVFDSRAYTADNLPAVALLLLLYGWAVAPVMYCLHWLFSTPSTAYA